MRHMVRTPSRRHFMNYLNLSFFVPFFFNDTATTAIYTLSLHDALPISDAGRALDALEDDLARHLVPVVCLVEHVVVRKPPVRSEEHTSELQSPVHLVCRLLLEKKKTTLSPTL